MKNSSAPLAFNIHLSKIYIPYRGKFSRGCILPGSTRPLITDRQTRLRRERSDEMFVSSFGFRYSLVKYSYLLSR